MTSVYYTTSPDCNLGAKILKISKLVSFFNDFIRNVENMHYFLVILKNSVASGEFG